MSEGEHSLYQKQNEFQSKLDNEKHILTWKC